MTDALAQARKALEARITEYLTNGGLFNPEMMPQGPARDLLIDCRSALAAIDAALEGGAVPKVRSLEWQKHNVDGTIWDAPSITGGYVVRFDGKEWLTVKNIIVLARSNTCADAKASAQAHLDEKVLSALDLPSPPTGA